VRTTVLPPDSFIFMLLLRHLFTINWERGGVYIRELKRRKFVNFMEIVKFFERIILEEYLVEIHWGKFLKFYVRMS